MQWWSGPGMVAEGRRLQWVMADGQSDQSAMVQHTVHQVCTCMCMCNVTTDVQSDERDYVYVHRAREWMYAVTQCACVQYAVCMRAW